MRSLFLLVVALTGAACGSSSTAPTPTPQPPPVLTPAQITLSGHLTATNGGQPLANVQADLSGQIALTDGAGGFSYQLAPGNALRLALTGSGIVPRSLTVAVGSSREVTIDAISTAGFDLPFYRQLVRNNFEGGMEPLRRWTRNPNVFLQTGPDLATLDMVEREVRGMVFAWSTGALSVATVERGTGSREGQAGWLTVRWDASAAHCGLADVGREGGAVTLALNQPRCACGGYSIAPSAIRHEVGHAMGFWHTDRPADLMFATYGQCDRPASARELAAAAIAYARPVGNADPDADPVGVVTLAPLRVY